jgi:rhamnosyltransferase subunit B
MIMSTKHTVLLPTFGSSGDVNPFVIIGRELQRRGHRTVLITNPYFQRQIEEADLEFIGVGTEKQYLEAINDPDLWHPTRSFYRLVEHAILGIMQPVYEAIIQFDPTRTIIAAPGIIFGARLAHESHGFPYATVQLAPSIVRTVHEMPIQGSLVLPRRTPMWMKRGWIRFLDWAVIDKAIGPQVNTFREELGLAPAKHFFGDYLHASQLSIGLFPDWFAPIQPDWPPQFRLTGFIHAADEDALLPDDLDAFLSDGPRPIVFTAGSAMRLGEEFFATAVESCRQLDCRGVLIARYAEQLPRPLPPNVRHWAFAPFDLLVPRAATLVHHGGIGTLAQALAAGVPHLVMPMGHDQPDNAQRLARLGVGKTLPPKSFIPERVAEALAFLGSDSNVQARCRKLMERVNFADALSETCDLIGGLQ